MAVKLKLALDNFKQRHQANIRDEATNDNEAVDIFNSE